jgi:CYTH domain-containing protein
MMTIYSPITRSKKIIEIALNKTQFDELWKHTKGHRIRKKRFFHKDKKQKYSIDIFQGKHKGLVIACASFEDETSAINFKAPNWLGKDVTSDENYDIKNLVFL